MKKIEYAYKNTSFYEKRPVIILDICEYLTPIMNEIHGLNYSKRFWVRILQEYVKTCINRINYMSKPCDNYIVPLFPINSWEPINNNEYYKRWLLHKAKELQAKGKISELRKILEENNDICFGIRGKLLESYNIGKYVEKTPLYFMKKENSKRKKIEQYANNEKDNLIKNILLQVPKYYVEYFNHIMNNIPIVNNPSRITFHSEHGSGVFMNLLVARYVEMGARVYSYQLGGYIGETQNSMNPIKYYIIDKHLTYGWKIHEKDEPSYAFRLEEFKKKYKNARIKNEKYLLLMYNNINTVEIKNKYKENTDIFINNIDLNKYPNILLRPRGISRRINNSSELKYLNKKNICDIDDGKEDIAITTKSSKIVVHWNVPATNFLECIYVNHPVVGILTNEKPTQIIKPYYEFFIEYKVLHNDIKSMIEHLNSVDIKIWWEEVVAKKKYKEFKYKFTSEVPIKSKKKMYKKFNKK